MDQDTENLLVHPDTDNQIKAFYNHPANVLLITGRSGSGKTAVAQLLGARLLGITPAKLSNYSDYILISKPADKAEISIDSVRQLIAKMALKVPTKLTDKKLVNRVAIIEDAGFMSTEAQNAMLKLLEEPPAGSLLILTAGNTDSLLSTIASRAQTIRIIPPSLDQSLIFFSGHQKSEVESAWNLSQGSPGLLKALLSESDEHPLKAGVADAKQFLGLSSYNKLLKLQEIGKDKARFMVFLDALARVLSALYTQSVRGNRSKNAEKILQARQAVEKSLAQSAANANQRFIFLALVLGTRL
jgi:hypothetical protein